MKKLAFLSLLLAAGLFLSVPRAQAQAQIEIGPRIGYEVDQLNQFSVGADLRISSFALPFQINGAFDYYFMDEDFDFDAGDEREDAFVGAETVMRFTVNGLLQFGLDNQMFTPYAGAGISLARISYDQEALDFFDDLDDTDTEVGLNLVGGAEFGIGAIRPFVQGEFVVGGDVQPVAVTGGLLFSF